MSRPIFFLCSLSAFLASIITVSIAGPSRPTQHVFANTTVIEICSDSIVRVARVPSASNLSAINDRVSLIAKRDWEPVEYSMKSVDGVTTFVTAKISVSVTEDLGQVEFRSLTGKVLLSEKEHNFTPVTDMGKSTYRVQQSWSTNADESLYGGGEFQNGFLDFKNVPVQLVQFNTEAVVPFFVSNIGYGLLWDNYAWTHLNGNQSHKINFTAPLTASRTSEPLNVALTDSLPQGTPIIGRPCELGDTDHSRQFWMYDPQGKRFHSQNEGATDLVMDYDHTSGTLHLWGELKNQNTNQEWFLNGSLLQSTDKPPLCLEAQAPNQKGYIVKGVACNIQSDAQHWALTKSGQLQLQDTSNTCLTADTSANEVTYTFTAKKTGSYGFYVDSCPEFGCGFGKTVVLNITENGAQNKELINWDQLSNLPDAISARANLIAGKVYKLTFKSNAADLHNTNVYMTSPEQSATTLTSDIADVIDYYFTFEAEGNIDGAIRGYRAVTGVAPIYARWAYGFWQCKEHYDTQEHLLEAAHGYRSRFIPVDNIVQDWHYWGDLGWGPHWDPKVYPDPAGMVQELKGINMQLMVSVWSKFDTNTIFYKTMESDGQMLGSSNYYDAWNPMARTQFYEYSKQSMFDIGVSCLWLDATEPENFPNENAQSYLGTGNSLFNSYSLMTTKAISDGLREDFPEEQGARVFTLTRSSFAGQQKNGACLWSGDISGNWDSLRRQVAASLNYQLSGIPYWSEDIGGFFRPDDQYTSPDYHNLLIRWFQFGSFTPIYRVHGGGSNTEIWNYGSKVETILNATSNLRYRMIPYIYSGFYRVEIDGYTMQRALVFDFPNDIIARQTPDQFMWGDALMVSPIITNSTSRDVYFPAEMVDFHTGKTVAKGLQKGVEAPLDTIPLHAPKGAILPLGPLMQWTGEKAADPLEIRVYDGASGSFTLFEDDGASLDYRNGMMSTIEFTFDENMRSLTIGARQGGFPGMLSNRTFNIVFVRENHGVGPNVTPGSEVDEQVFYNGTEIKVIER